MSTVKIYDLNLFQNNLFSKIKAFGTSIFCSFLSNSYPVGLRTGLVSFLMKCSLFCFEFEFINKIFFLNGDIEFWS